MRLVADRERIDAFFAALARYAASDATIYVVGGTSAVLVGWRNTTIDLDLMMRPESDSLLRAIPALKEQLNINVELAWPEQFIPVPEGWEDRSPLIARLGRLTIRHYDFVSQALAKIERGHGRDIDDVRAMIDRGLITARQVREQFARIEPELYRYPAVHPASFRRAVDALFDA